MTNNELVELREKLDGINLSMLKLINERAEVVRDIGRVKEKQGVNKYDPLRERAMLDLIEENNQGPLDQSTVKHIFKEIFKMSLDLQKDEEKKHYLFLERRNQKIQLLRLKVNK